MEDRFEISTYIVCIKEVDSLKLKSIYKVDGCGDLSMNAATTKTGYGYRVFNQVNDVKEWWKLPYSEQIKHYYFTLEEMSEYFITSEENYLIEERNKKLNTILANGNWG